MSAGFGGHLSIHYLPFTIHPHFHLPFTRDENSFRQAQQHRRHRACAAGAGGGAAGAAAGGDFVGRGATFGGNSEGQPVHKYSHRSGHEGLEALAGVWGDAAGNAPTVAPVTRLTLRPSHRFSGTSQISINREALGRTAPRGLRARAFARAREPIPPDEDGPRPARTHVIRKNLALASGALGVRAADGRPTSSSSPSPSRASMKAKLKRLSKMLDKGSPY
jgi:hypothetical protein